MPNEKALAKIDPVTALVRTERQTQAPSANPYEDYADYISPKYIVGELLKFSKGDYVVGEKEIVAVETVIVPVMDSLMAGWVHWDDGRPSDHIMGSDCSRIWLR